MKNELRTFEELFNEEYNNFKALTSNGKTALAIQLTLHMSYLLGARHVIEAVVFQDREHYSVSKMDLATLGIIIAEMHKKVADDFNNIITN